VHLQRCLSLSRSAEASLEQTLANERR